VCAHIDETSDLSCSIDDEACGRPFIALKAAVEEHVADGFPAARVKPDLSGWSGHTERGVSWQVVDAELPPSIAPASDPPGKVG